VFVLIRSTNSVDLAVHLLRDAPDDAPILLVCHALGFCAPMYAPLVRSLGSEVRCLGIDLRFHGRSTPPLHPTFEWPEFADDVLAVIDSALVPSDAVVHGFGHSLGGAAMTIASSRAPGRFRSLYLYEPVVVPPDAAVGARGSHPMAEMTEKRRARFESRDAARQNFASKPPFSTFDRDALDAYVEHALEDESEGGASLRCRPAWEAELYRSAERSGAWERAPNVGARVRLAMGRTDVGGPARFAERIADRFGAQSPTRFEGLAHFGPFEAPARVASDLDAWLDQTT